MTGPMELRQLRGAIARGDGGVIVQQLSRRPWPTNRLQLIGDGLLLALDQEVETSSTLVSECVDALRARGWDGDQELADLLDGRLGVAPTALLRRLTIDLEEPAMILEGDPVYGGGRIDRRTGEVWPQPAIDYAVEMGEEDEDESEDDERWLQVDCEGSRAAYNDMASFIADLDDPKVADRLSSAIRGRGAFRRFGGALDRWPDLIGPWQDFSDDRQRGRARSWLAARGYAAIPRTLGDS